MAIGFVMSYIFRVMVEVKKSIRELKGVKMKTLGWILVVLQLLQCTVIHNEITGGV